MSEVEFCGVSKRFGSQYAVADLNLAIEKGQMVALLGPSGCGKTTSLRMLAGFIEPSDGKILIRGADVTNLPPYKRDTAMVFQSYALFPHLTVRDNVAYGLRRRGVPKEEIARRVAAALELVQIGELAMRYPKAISGGQQQRVAVARAMVLQPAILLLDEPFSALDAQVRESTRVEMRKLQQENGFTALLVTHDQQEALSVADLIVVMNKGRIEQIGKPIELYDHPASPFVAEFIGAANIMTGKLRVVGDQRSPHVFVSEGGLELQSLDPIVAFKDIKWAVLRSEDIRISATPPHEAMPNCAVGVVEIISFLGTFSHVVVRLPSGEQVSTRGDRSIASSLRNGDTVYLSWDVDKVRLLG